jgi:hypothetical protein
MATTRRKRVGKKVGTSVGQEVATEVSEQVDEGESVGSIFDRETGTRVALYRIDDKSKKWVYHGMLTVEESTEEFVSSLFGGGRYKLQLRGQNEETGHEAIRAVREMLLPGEYRPPRGFLPGTKVEAPASVAVAPATAPMTTPDTSMSVMMQLFALQQSIMTNSLEQQRAASERQQQMAEQSRKDTEMLFKTMMEMRNTQTAKDPMDYALKLVEVMKETTSKKSDVKELIEGMSSIMNFRDEMMPAKDTGDPVFESINKTLDLVQAGMHQQQQQRQPPRPAPALAAPAPVTSLPTEGAVPVSEPDTPVWHKILTSQKERLLKFAREGMDPAFVAEMAVKMAPANMKGVITEFFSSEQALEWLYAAIPELQQFPKWSQDFLSYGYGVVAPEDATEDEGEGAEEVEGTSP